MKNVFIITIRIIGNGFIKEVTVTSILIFFVSMASAQIKSGSSSELKDIIFNRNGVLSLIDANFIPYKQIGWEKRFEQHEHPNKDQAIEFYYKLNRIPTKETSVFTFFGLPVNDVFAYLQVEDKFALYFTCYLDQAAFDNIFLSIGNPENLFDDEKLSVNGSMYYWPLKGMNLMMSNRPFGSFKGKWTVSIFNLPYKEQRREE